MVADPLKPPIAKQLLSLSVLTLKVLDTEGVTETMAGLTEEVNDKPLESVPFHGAMPVKAMLIDELRPAQISAEPESDAVGRAMVVTATLELLATGHGLLAATTR